MNRADIEDVLFKGIHFFCGALMLLILLNSFCISLDVSLFEYSLFDFLIISFLILVSFMKHFAVELNETTSFYLTLISLILSFRFGKR
jgi:hypothetical protein